MALAKLRPDYTPAPAGPASHFDRDRVRRELATYDAADEVMPQDKWAPRNAAGLIVLTSAAMWAALVYGSVQLVRLAF